MIEKLEVCESYDDDLYDGAAEITKRGRIEVLENVFLKDYDDSREPQG